jgi:phenylalanyl-tRNA synthetase alpha chain
MDLYEKLNGIKLEAEERIKVVKTLHTLNEVKSKYLGKNGSFSEVMKLMKDLPKEDKPRFGQVTNEAKQAILKYIDEQKALIE